MVVEAAREAEADPQPEPYRCRIGVSASMAN
jgi:hypothetical protein